ncbi:hypothetical protein MMIC_P0241 [Mariprofundus micogutta]|uniref:Uncharacterized protein n=1 Tax=Mariprofundus micogutta TaxID=1921010 RepID=A0A1L8CK67_9PROT|nr:hypothetical protein MMIC_P0241 [Mariprofundus micogutta]
MYIVQQKENVTFNRRPSTSYKLYEWVEDNGIDVAVFRWQGFCLGFDSTDEDCINDYLDNQEYNQEL